jgi:hypothetical protein
MDMRGLCCTFLFAELGWGWAGPAGADPPISDGSLKPVAAFSAIVKRSDSANPGERTKPWEAISQI